MAAFTVEVLVDVIVVGFVGVTAKAEIQYGNEGCGRKSSLIVLVGPSRVEIEVEVIVFGWHGFVKVDVEVTVFVTG